MLLRNFRCFYRHRNFCNDADVLGCHLNADFTVDAEEWLLQGFGRRRKMTRNPIRKASSRRVNNNCLRMSTKRCSIVEPLLRIFNCFPRQGVAIKDVLSIIKAKVQSVQSNYQESPAALFVLNCIPDEMMNKIYVFGAWMTNRVLCKYNSCGLMITPLRRRNKETP